MWATCPSGSDSGCTCGSISINLLMVLAKVFLIPLMYLKVIRKGEISIAQLLTLGI